MADCATLSDERRSHSKNFLLFNMDKRTLRSKISRARKILGFSQTKGTLPYPDTFLSAGS